MANEFLNSLQEKRFKWVEATKENNFEAGINNLLTELYPDNAHFIYELLQNAEDAGAQKVIFELHPEKLLFRHNGIKLFDYKDVEGITSIGQGTKKNDINKIGKFGVGFKAVFAYTNSPAIHSGDFNLEINQLVIPNEIGKISKKETETVFVFPFNHQFKKKNLAYEEIKKGLKDLSNITLLFLSSIQEIEILFEGLKYQIIKNENNSTPFVSIKETYRNTTFSFLRFKKLIQVNSHRYVSIAFKIEKDKNSSKQYLEAFEKGKVSIFFPAEKETSNLRFHIHAPFSSTVARDSIKNQDDNNQLILLLAELLCEATDWIKENNLLDFNYLRCLPNNDDALPEFYKPIQKRIVDLFQKKEYLLCDDNKYHPANQCIRAPKVIKDVFDIQSYKLLKGLEKDSIFWMKNPPQNNSREDKFIQTLGVKEIKDNELLLLLKSQADNYVELSKADNDSKVLKNHKLTLLLEGKNNEWVRIFYQLLLQLILKENNSWYKHIYQNFRIFIKLKDGKFNFKNSECFFPSQTKIKSLHYCFVDPAIYETEKNEKNQKSKAREFLEYLGVKEITIKNEIDSIINDYYKSSNEKNFDDNIQHIKLFIKYYSETRNQYSPNYENFQKTDFLVDKKNCLQYPDKILIDNPYKETNLKIIEGDNDRYLLNNYYSEKLSKNDLELLIDFLKVLGCHFQLPIEKRSASNHRNYSSTLYYYAKQSDYLISKDFDLCDKTKQRLRGKQIDFSLFIWSFMSNLKSDGEYFNASYRANQSSSYKTDSSSMIYTLMEEIWVPDKKGVFHKPADIAKDELHEKFVFKDENGWLTKIGFGKNKNQNKEELKKVDEILKSRLDYSLSTLEEAKSAGVTDEDIHRLIEEKKKKNKLQNAIPDLGESIEKHTRNIQPKNDKPNPDIVKDEQNYRDKAQNRLNKSIEKSKTEKKNYNTTVKVKVGKEETRQFFKNQYKGYCQICGFSFDQSGGKGKYFELFDWYSEKVTKQSSNILDAGSALCLCSRCHSVLKHGDFSPVFLNEIKDSTEPQFSDFKQHFENVKGDIEIPEVFRGIEFDLFKAPIRLLNKSEYIYYTEEHFLLFYNMWTLNSENEELTEGILNEEYEGEFHIPEIAQTLKKVVEVGTKVHLIYLNTRKEIRIKLVEYKSIFSTRNGISEILTTSPFGKKIMGKTVGHIIEMGEQRIKILGIE